MIQTEFKKLILYCAKVKVILVFYEQSPSTNNKIQRSTSGLQLDPIIWRLADPNQVLLLHVYPGYHCFVFGATLIDQIGEQQTESPVFTAADVYDVVPPSQSL